MSEVRANTISDAAGTGPVTLTGQWASKGWYNFNGTGTAALRDSENVSSLIDSGVGNFTINWTAVFPSASYSWTHGPVGTSAGSNLYELTKLGGQLAGSVTMTTWYGQNALINANDYAWNMGAAFGDSA